MLALSPLRDGFEVWDLFPQSLFWAVHDDHGAQGIT